MLLIGDGSTRVATDRRELVLKRINPFSEAKRKLFGSGFEQRLKLRSETAETVKKASKIGQPFFRVRPLVVSHDRVGPCVAFMLKLPPNANKDVLVQSGKRIPRQISPLDFKTQRHSTPSRFDQIMGTSSRYVFRFSLFTTQFEDATRCSSKTFCTGMGKNYSRPVSFASSAGLSNQISSTSSAAGPCQKPAINTRNVQAFLEQGVQDLLPK